MDWWKYLQGLQQDYLQGIQSNLDAGMNWWQNQNGLQNRAASSPQRSGFSIPETRTPGSGVYPWQTISSQVGSPQPNLWNQVGQAVQGVANSPLNPIVAGNMVRNNLSQPRPAQISSGGKSVMDSSSVVPQNTGTANQSQYPIGSGNNPNEPGKMANQYTNPSAWRGGTLPASNGQQTGGQIVITPLQRGEKTLDTQLGDGWSAQFTAKHGGMSPIQFYGNAFQQIQDPEQRMGAAINAAINDANFQPGAIDEWRRVHGAQEIPQEQWETWWRMAQRNGGQPSYGQGAGINPYGVY